MNDKHLKFLTLNNVMLERNSINKFLATGIDVDLFDTPINNLDAAKNLCSAIKDHPMLEKVSITKCNIGSNLSY